MKLKEIFLYFFSWRIWLFIISAIAIFILPVFGNRFPYVNEVLKSSGLPAWFWQFGNFDGVHYVGIAGHGYERQFTQAFFPVYPILIKFVSPFFFGNFVLTGIVLSSVFTFLAAWMFVKLLKVGNGLDHSLQLKNIKWIILFFLLFPMSFFFGSIYNESFFLFLVFSVFYFAKKRNWFLAGIIGAVACGTRLVGIFLFPAVLYEYYKVVTGFKPVTTNKKIINIFFISLIPFGLLLYMLYLQLNFHDALYFLHAQSVFGASRSAGVVLPFVTLWRYVKILTTVPIFQYDFWVAFWEAGFFVFGGIILAIISIIKFKVVTGLKPVTTNIYNKLGEIDTSFLIFSWGAFLLPVFTGTLSSFPRYLLVCFPMYMFLGNISKTHVKLTILIVFTILNLLFSILFLRGYWVS